MAYIARYEDWLNENDGIASHIKGKNLTDVHKGGGYLVYGLKDVDYEKT